MSGKKSDQNNGGRSKSTKRTYDSDSDGAGTKLDGKIGDLKKSKLNAKDDAAKIKPPKISAPPSNQTAFDNGTRSPAIPLVNAPKLMTISVMKAKQNGDGSGDKSSNAGRNSSAGGLQLFRDGIISEAHDLIQNIFPRRITELNDLLNSKELEQFEREAGNLLGGSAPTPPAKKKSGQNSSAQAKTDSNNSSSNASAIRRTNGQLREIINAVKPHLFEQIFAAKSIQAWLKSSLPRIEDGNNFGVEVIETIISYFKIAELQMLGNVEYIADFYAVRADRISRFVADETNVDETTKTAIEELDETAFCNLKSAVVDLRNNYADLLDMLLRNMDKLQKPRSDHSRDMY